MPESIQMDQRVRRAFFGPFGGRPRPLQELAYQKLEPGRDALIMAGTGSGKTEAVLAPVAQGLCRAGLPDGAGIRCLIVSPTRALGTDLHRRMSPVLEQLGLRLDVATGDRRTIGRTPTDILIRTPEGLDRDLCYKPGELGGVTDVIIDELHKFLDDPRGTQLAGLLARLSEYAPRHRRLGISATVPNPGAPHKAHLLRDPVVVDDPSGVNSMEVIYHDWFGEKAFLRDLRERGIRKGIGFARTRARCEELSHRLDTGFLRNRCFPHHAAISSTARRRVEECMRKWPTMMVVATTTLEVGIDIGDIDACILFDAPPDRDSFVQRAGRSGRRSGRRRVICVHGLHNRRTDFAEVLGQSKGSSRGDYRPSMVGFLQQLFSRFIQDEQISREYLYQFAMDGFGVPASVMDALQHCLVEDGYVMARNDRLEATEKLLGLVTGGRVHMTFSGNAGVRVFNAGNGAFIGHCDVNQNNNLLLGGKAWKIRHQDRESHRVLVDPAPDGTAAFQMNSVSIFEILATRYSSCRGRVFRG